MTSILVVDDEPIIRDELRELFVGHGYDVVVAGSVAEAAAEHDLDGFDLVITDLYLPDVPGTALIAQAGKTPVLVITAYASVETAVEAMKRGAKDYITKPFNTDELLLVVERLVADSLQRRRVAALAKDLGKAWPVAGMIGSCSRMREVTSHIDRFAKSDVTVLIRGESGTGKELVARAIHDRSRRHDAPFVAVNCGAIAETLAASELFGHEKDAFTGATKAREGLFEAAHGGTLFLDEIGELPSSMQSCLFRVLEDREIRRVGATRARKVDVRLLAATNRDLRNGTFRVELFYRLRVGDIVLPPLRERGADVEELVIHFWAQAARRSGKGDLKLTPEALAAVRDHHWPGNVRELQNAIERAAILCDTGRITPELLGIEEPVAMPAEEAALSASVDEYFTRFVLENQDHLSETEIARRLGMTRTGLWKKRARLNIPRRTSRPPAS